MTSFAPLVLVVQCQQLSYGRDQKPCGRVLGFSHCGQQSTACENMFCRDIPAGTVIDRSIDGVDSCSNFLSLAGYDSHSQGIVVCRDVVARSSGPKRGGRATAAVFAHWQRGATSLWTQHFPLSQLFKEERTVKLRIRNQTRVGRKAEEPCETGQKRPKRESCPQESNFWTDVQGLGHNLCHCTGRRNPAASH